MDIMSDTGNNENRLTAVETKLSGQEQILHSLGVQLTDGFRDVKAGISELAHEFDTKLNTAHRRIDEHTTEEAKRGQFSWPVVAVFFTMASILGTVIVGFVIMTVTPMQQRTQRMDDRNKIELAEQNAAMMREIKRVEAIYDLADRRTRARLEKLECWDMWWVQSTLEGRIPYVALGKTVRE